MRKKILISLFLVLTSINGVYGNLEIQKDSVVEPSIEKFKDIENVGKITKKDIKKEIKSRKKYHKTLLEKYNSSFDSKILEYIQENSIILLNLRIELKK